MFKEEPDEIVDKVLFDEDEMRGTGSSGHSKIGTEETTSVSTNGDDEEDTGRWNGLAHKEEIWLCDTFRHSAFILCSIDNSLVYV